MKIFLTLLIPIFLLCGVADAARQDFYSRDWWVQKSGISSGTVNDIQKQYLGSMGYLGGLNDRIKAWLVDVLTETFGGDYSSFTTNDLIYQCFDASTACDDFPLGIGVDGYFQFAGANLTFGFSQLQFNP